MLKLKIDILQALKEKGFTSYYLRKNGLLGEKTIQELRKQIVPGIKSIDIICTLLNCQISDIIEHIPENDAFKK